MASKEVTMTAGKLKASYDLKGKTTLNIVDNYTTGVSAQDYIAQFLQSIDAVGNNIILNCEQDGYAYKVTLKNCTSLKTLRVKLSSDSYEYNDENLYTLFYDYKNDITKPTKGTTVTGSFMNDRIDVLNGYVPTEKNLKNKVGVTINAGAGNDEIKATALNDTITGGLGQNTVYVVKDTFGNDTINLTSKEGLIIDLSAYSEYASAYDFKGKIEVSGKNLVITLPKDAESDYGKIALKNFAKTNVTGDTETAYVKLKLKNGDYVNLNTDKFLKDNSYTLTSNAKKKTAAFTGSRFSETITLNSDILDGYTKTINAGNGENTINVYSKGKLTINGGADADYITVDSNDSLTTVKAGDGHNTVTIVAGTGASSVTTGKHKDDITISNSGNATVNSGAEIDTIVTGAGNDTINAGDGADVITARGGNDKLTGGKGADTFVFSKNDGVDTITDATAEDIIAISGVDNKEALRYARSGNNLEIFYSDEFDTNNKIIVQNHFVKKGKVENRIGTTLKVNNDEGFTLDTINNLAISGSGKINGDNNANIIVGSAKADKINALGGDDIIYGEGGNDAITGGMGTNTYIFRGESFGNDTINLTAGENALLDFSAYDGLTDENITYTISGNNLVIKPSNYGQVTISNFKKSDITGENGSVLLKLAQGEPINLKTKEYSVSTKANYTGGWLDEKVDATTAAKGLTFNTGKGNDTITVNNKGKNTYIFTSGDGTDKIENAQATDVIQFEKAVDLSFRKIGDDLKINYGGADSITIDGFYEKEKCIDTIKIKNGKKYKTFSITKDAVIDVEVTGNSYVKTSKYNENLIIPKDIEEIEISGLKSADKITLAEEQSQNNGGLYAPRQIGENEPIFTRTNGDGLVINGNIKVVDFFDNGEDFDINYDNTLINTKDAVITVTLDNDFSYTSTKYDEIFKGTGTITGIKDNDALSLSGDLRYDRTATNNDLTITGNDGVIKVVDFFINGDVNFADGTTTENAIVHVDLAGQDYTSTKYDEIFTGSGSIKNLTSDDSIVFEKGSETSYALSLSGLTVTGGGNTILIAEHLTPDLEGVNVLVGEKPDDVSNKTLTVASDLVESVDAANLEFKDYAIKFTGIDNFYGFSFRGNFLTSEEETSLFITRVLNMDQPVENQTFETIEVKNYFNGVNIVSDKAPKTFILEKGEFSHTYTLEWRETLISGEYSMFNVAETAEDYVVGLSHWIEGTNIQGVGSNDVLVGTTGEDTIKASFYGAQIYGGQGNDTLTGGEYSDIFLFKVGDGEDTITNANEGDAIYIGDKNAANDINVEYVLFNRGELGGNLEIRYGYGEDLDNIVNVPFDISSERNINNVYVWNRENQQYMPQQIKNAIVYGVELDEYNHNYDASQVSSQYRQEIVVKYGSATICNLNENCRVVINGDNPNPQPNDIRLSREFMSGDTTLTINDTIKITDFFDGDEQHRKFKLNNYYEFPRELAVRLNDNQNVYEPDEYFNETITGYGIVSKLGQNDVLGLVPQGNHSLIYERKADSDDVKITGDNGEITVKNFFKDGDVNFADGTDSSNATIKVDLNNSQDYKQTKYAEIFTGSGTVDSIGKDDSFLFSNSGANLKFTLSNKGLEIAENGGNTIYIQQYGYNDNLVVYTGDNMDEYRLDDKTLYVEDAQQFNATNYPFRYYNITGTDSGDEITGGYDADTINAGKGENIIYFNSENGNGNDTLIDGGGEDTLVFSEGTDLSFEEDNNDLIITYGQNSETIRLKDYATGTSVKYIQIGDVKKSFKEFYQKTYTLELKDSMKGVTISDKENVSLVLNNSLTENRFVYDIVSSSGDQTVNFEYLENGRLYIDGDYLRISADKGQADDIILMGNHNEINTDDGDDKLRVGHVIDSNYEYFDGESGFNTINTGSGKDYITFFGTGNQIDAGDDIDNVMMSNLYSNCNCKIIKDGDIYKIIFEYPDYGWVYDDDPNIITISDGEDVRLAGDVTTSTDNQVGWFEQGNSGGDCRLLSMLDSLSRGKNFSSLSDYVEYSTNDNENYTVTFKNSLSGNKTTVININEIQSQYDQGMKVMNVFGDLDVIIVDYALNDLLYTNIQKTVETVSYNDMASYIFGNEDITVISYDIPEDDFENNFKTLCQKYQNGEISNLTIGINKPDYKLGIIGAHAYSVKDISENYITLVNPWDSSDSVTLSIDKLCTYSPSAIVYGYDVFDQHIRLESTYFALSEACDVSEICNDIAAWSNESSGIIAETTACMEENASNVLALIKSDLDYSEMV